MPQTFSPSPVARWRRSSTHRTVLALLLAALTATGLVCAGVAMRTDRAAERLTRAADGLRALTDGAPPADTVRAAVAWGYAARLRLGLESPFRLVEAASRDPRLAPAERRTVSQGLLARLLAGHSHELDPAALDGMGGITPAAPGESHLALIGRAVRAAEDPRAGELGTRIAYTLAATERVVDASAPMLAASVAALLADREVATREAHALLRGGGDPIRAVRDRRARRAFYVERPVLLDAPPRLERDALEIAQWMLDSLRTLPRDTGAAPVRDAVPDGSAFLSPLFEAGKAMPPVAPLGVTVTRHAPAVRGTVRGAAAERLAAARNAEMLVAAVSPATAGATRAERRAVGRLLIAAAVALRSRAQEPVWFPGDSVPDAAALASALGLSAITFDAAVPAAWRPYYLRQLADGIVDLRRVLPDVGLHGVRVRFRMTRPADSALAMHEPRTRTLHLPVGTAGGTLTHELAHDLDRQVALQLGHLGYRSDFVARNAPRDRRSESGNVSASLRALTAERGATVRAAGPERPAEIFATQVDWFVARALASRGVSNGFLSAVQDELLTGHVVHPERLGSSSRGRSLVDALQGMTTIAAYATVERDPSLHALLRWSLSAPVDRGVTGGIGGRRPAWSPPALDATLTCEPSGAPRARLLHMAAESRARGWLRQRARWTGDREPDGWARAIRSNGPWSDAAVEARVNQLRNRILLQMEASALLPSGIAAHAAPLAAAARCG